MLDPVLVYIICESHAYFFFKKHGQVACVYIELLCQYIESEIGAEIGIDIGECFAYDHRIILQTVPADQFTVFMYHFFAESNTLAYTAKLFDTRDRTVGMGVDMDVHLRVRQIYAKVY